MRTIKLGVNHAVWTACVLWKNKNGMLVIYMENKLRLRSKEMVKNIRFEWILNDDTRIVNDQSTTNMKTAEITSLRLEQ